VLRLTANGRLDAAIGVYHRVRSEFAPVACEPTGSEGRASVALYASPRGTYFVGVAARRGSVDGTFTLRALIAERSARPPGDELPANGVRSTLNAVLDRRDAWSVQMDRGTTYRLNLSSGACVGLQIFRAGIYSFETARPVLESDCGGYHTFTPGPDGGGRYTVLVFTQAAGSSTHRYLLTFAAAETDDVAPGLELPNGSTIRGHISGLGIDNVDLYRITVPRDHEQTTIDFREKPTAGMDLMLLGEDGRAMGCACDSSGAQRMRRVLRAGYYFVAVRSRGKSGGPYSIGVVSRDITTTTLTANGATKLDLAPGSPVTFLVQVAEAHEGGPVTLEIQQFDPLVHWQFSTLYRRQIGSDGIFGVTWTPPSIGHWRAHARFFGTRFSSFSKSAWVRVRVAEPLGQVQP
jgi:hypothetical protein